MISTQQKQRQPQRQHHRLNNAGFSIFELLVVVAIMGVVMGMASATYAIVNKSNTRKCASTINDCLSTCKEKAMTNAAKEWKVVLTDHKVEVIKVSMDDETEVESTYELPKHVSITVNGADVPTDYTSVSIVFNSSGEVSRVYSDAISNIKGDGNGLIISCKYKDKKSYNIKLYYATGKHSYE